jgi:hypothetical protein
LLILLSPWEILAEPQTEKQTTQQHKNSVMWIPRRAGLADMRTDEIIERRDINTNSPSQGQLKQPQTYKSLLNGNPEKYKRSFVQIIAIRY